MSPTQIELGNYGKPAENPEKEDVKAISIPQFLGEVKTEFTKITWPSKEQVVREFFSVILLVSILTGVIFLIDKGLKFVLNIFNGNTI